MKIITTTLKKPLTKGMTMRITYVMPMLIGACSVLIGCASTMPQYVPSSKFTDDFQPVTPIKISDKSYTTLADKKKIFTALTSFVSIKKKDASGNASYSIGGSVTAEAGSYSVVMDFAAYDIIKMLSPKDGSLTAYGKEGVGLRITADVVTTKEKLNLSGLPSLAAEAKASSLTGTIKTDVLGEFSADVLNLVPLTSEIDQTSIGTILQALAGIKTKITDDGTTVTPYLLSVKNVKDDVSTTELSKSFFEGYAHAKPLSLTKDEILELVKADNLNAVISKLGKCTDPEIVEKFSKLSNIDDFATQINGMYIGDNAYKLHLIRYELGAK